MHGEAFLVVLGTPKLYTSAYCIENQKGHSINIYARFAFIKE